MQIGFITDSLKEFPLDKVLIYAAQHKIDCLEFSRFKVLRINES